MSGGRRGALVAVLVIAFGIGGGCSSKTGPAGGDTGAAAAPFVMPSNLPPITENKILHYINADSYARVAERGEYAALERDINEWLATRLDRDSRYNLITLCAFLAKAEGIEPRLDEWQKQFPESHYPHLVRGIRHIAKAWEARGTGWGSSVTEEGWRGMREHLAQARTELEQAQKMRPEDPNPSAHLITVELGQEGNTAAMEEQFARVMANDPCHTEAYFSKMNFFYPKWHGSWEEAKAVATEATLKGAYNPYLFLLLPMYHREQSERAEQRTGYYRDPAVRNELDTHYQAALAQFPDDYMLHASYAKDAWAFRDFGLSLEEYALATELADSGAVDFQNEDAELGLAETYNFYAWILATSPNDRVRDGERALACAKKAVALRPTWTHALDTLAEAYAETGDFANAIKYTHEALKYCDIPGMTRHMEKNLLLFEQEQPFRSRYQ